MVTEMDCNLDNVSKLRAGITEDCLDVLHRLRHLIHDACVHHLALTGSTGIWPNRTLHGLAMDWQPEPLSAIALARLLRLSVCGPSLRQPRAHTDSSPPKQGSKVPRQGSNGRLTMNHSGLGW